MSSFSTAEAKEIIEKYQSIRDKLDNIPRVKKKYREEIISSSDRLIEYDTKNALLNIPVDRLNSIGQGIRVGVLHDNGYHTIADLERLTVEDTASIRGIGWNMAFQIHRCKDNVIDQVKNSMKIRLSVDNRNDASTELVKMISCYINVSKIANDCERLDAEYRNRIDDEINNLRRVDNKIKRFFQWKVPKKKQVKHSVIFRIYTVLVRIELKLND